jgi:hypothetical protein
MTESGKQRPWRPAALLAAGMIIIGGAVAAPAPDTAKRILLLPPLRWDSEGQAWSYATEQNPIELARVMNGLTFGMTPEEASRHLPGAGGVLHWNDLPQANEFSEDVRYVWLPMTGAVAFRKPVTSCFGDASYIVLLFLNNALFRASFRFLPGQGCHDPYDAAEELYGAYVPLADNLAITVLYRTGDAAVVDVTDPAAGPLVATRWQARGQ